MNIAQAKCIPIDRYLAQQGHAPKSTRMGGRELWYHSPIRDGDETPSFKVDTIKNLWYDHGAATGGTIIELVCELCSCQVRDALRHLDRTGLYSVALSSPQIVSPKPKHRTSPNHSETKCAVAAAGEKEKTGALQLVKAGDLRHPALLQYLQKRGIDLDIARKYLRQIDFKRPESAGTYFGLGYPAGDGYEARNALFKGFVGTRKDITLHQQEHPKAILVFEGVMDFLSYLTIKPEAERENTIIVLNSTNLWRRALPYLEDLSVPEIKLYLDNDDAGDAVTALLTQNIEGKTVKDMRSYYAEFEDLNAWHKVQTC